MLLNRDHVLMISFACLTKLWPHIRTQFPRVQILFIIKKGCHMQGGILLHSEYGKNVHLFVHFERKQCVFKVCCGLLCETSQTDRTLHCPVA